MDYATNQLNSPTTQSRHAHVQWRAYRARKWARIVMIALILTGGVAAILEDDFGRSMRTQITDAVSQLEISKDETNKIGMFLQATVAKLDY